MVESNLENTTAGEMYSVHIHFNTASEGGGFAIDLNIVDGSTGESSTHVTDTAAMSYVFNSDNLEDTAKPDLSLKRGQTYTFAFAIGQGASGVVAVREPWAIVGSENDQSIIR